MAGFTTSYCVDDVVAVNKNNKFVKMACMACLSSRVYLMQSVPLPSQVHRILGATSATGRVVEDLVAAVRFCSCQCPCWNWSVHH